MGIVFSRISTIFMAFSSSLARERHARCMTDSLRKPEAPIIHCLSHDYSPKVKTETASEMAFFVLLAKKPSLSAAARELNITPPAVTKRLAQIEQRLGVRLLNRSTRKISLTSEGELYLSYATAILADIREMEDQASSS